MFVPERVKERIIHWADRSPTGCLVSRYSVGSHGYSQIGWHENGERIVTTAHRALWIATNGEIESGMTIDHICHNKQCVEIRHLRKITNLQNARRNGPGDWPLDGQCKHGHDSEHWKPKGPGRRKGYCSLCHKASNERYRAKTRA